MLKKVALTIIIVIFIAAFYSVYCYQQYLFKPETKVSTLFIVDKGATVGYIANKLKKQHLINNSFVFRYAALMTGNARKLEAGEYNILPHSSIKDILALFVSGKFYQHSFLVVEGQTVRQVANNLLKENALIGDLPSVLPREGSLLTTTINYLRGTTRQEILQRLVKGQKELVDKIWRARDLEIPLKNSDELIVMASLIEKETGQPSERRLIASVFYNRLQHKIRLQSDPTVIYGIFGGAGKPPQRPIFQSDLENINPYNTYKIDALPITPIANPGYQSLLAAAHPAKTNYLYFVANGQGGHVFSSNIAGHIKAVKMFRQIELNHEKKALQ